MERQGENPPSNSLLATSIAVEADISAGNSSSWSSHTAGSRHDSWQQPAGYIHS